jgi:hypothetical protein
MKPEEMKVFEHELWVAIHEGEYIKDWIYDDEIGEESAVYGFDEERAKNQVLALLVKYNLIEKMEGVTT